jgi:hypothetical protein
MRREKMLGGGRDFGGRVEEEGEEEGTGLVDVAKGGVHVRCRSQIVLNN